MALQRLQKILAAAGCGSRRECESFITDARVAVDGQDVTELGTRVDPATQEIRLDGELVRLVARRTWLFNKPRGVICSARGRPDMPMVSDYAPPEAKGERLFTVGRLDVESEGAILLTNDGELCHLVSHPRFGVEKTYRVEVRGVPDDETLEKMRKGVWLAEGRTGPLRIRNLTRRGEQAVLEVKVHEGMKREIRRVCARFGHDVKRLVRTSIGPITLERLAVGATRELSAAEERALRESARAVIRLGGQPVQKRGTAASRRALARTPEAEPEAPARSASRGTASRSSSGSGPRGQTRKGAPGKGHGARPGSKHGGAKSRTGAGRNTSSTTRGGPGPRHAEAGERGGRPHAGEGRDGRGKPGAGFGGRGARGGSGSAPAGRGARGGSGAAPAERGARGDSGAAPAGRGAPQARGKSSGSRAGGGSRSARPGSRGKGSGGKGPGKGPRGGSSGRGKR